jgi:hypothetical protein
MLPPAPVPGSLQATSFERRHFLDHDQTAQYPSRGSQSCSSRDSSLMSRKRDIQRIEVPLQVISNKKCSDFQQPAVDMLNKIAQARQDLTAPPSQIETQQSLRPTPPTRLAPPPQPLTPNSAHSVPPGSLRLQQPSFDHTAPSSSSGVSNAGCMANIGAPEAQQDRQLRQWGEGLSQQVDHLAVEKARIEKCCSSG